MSGRQKLLQIILENEKEKKENEDPVESSDNKEKKENKNSLNENPAKKVK